jgi:hypothetical protein
MSGGLPKQSVYPTDSNKLYSSIREFFERPVAYPSEIYPRLYEDTDGKGIIPNHPLFFFGPQLRFQGNWF